MNKDKQIKDLKERNDKLKNQYQLQEIRLHHLEYVNNKYKIVLDKIKEIVNKVDYDKWELQMTSIEKIMKIQKLLEEIDV